MITYICSLFMQAWFSAEHCYIVSIDRHILKQHVCGLVVKIDHLMIPI